jgi:hypothetical protein
MAEISKKRPENRPGLAKFSGRIKRARASFLLTAAAIAAATTAAAPTAATVMAVMATAAAATVASTRCSRHERQRDEDQGDLGEQLHHILLYE